VLRGSGSACESDGDGSDGQGAPQGGPGGVRGVQSTLVSARARQLPRSGNFAGFKGYTGQFHENIGASFYHPTQPPESSCFLSDVFAIVVFACLWREAETSQHKLSLGQRSTLRPVLSAWKNMRLFSRAKKISGMYPLTLMCLMVLGNGLGSSEATWAILGCRFSAGAPNELAP